MTDIGRERSVKPRRFSAKALEEQKSEAVNTSVAFNALSDNSVAYANVEQDTAIDPGSRIDRAAGR